METAAGYNDPFVRFWYDLFKANPYKFQITREIDDPETSIGRNGWATRAIETMIAEARNSLPAIQ